MQDSNDRLVVGLAHRTVEVAVLSFLQTARGGAGGVEGRSRGSGGGGVRGVEGRSKGSGGGGVGGVEGEE